MIRILGQFLLLSVLALLAAVAGWAGLNAIVAPPSPSVDRVPVLVRPDPLDAALGPFATQPPRAVEASVALTSGAQPRSGTVEVVFRGTRAFDGPDRIAVLEPRTLAALVTAPLAPEGSATQTLTGVPIGELLLVTHRSGESPRWRYAARVPFRLDGGTGPDEPRTRVTLDLTVSNAVVLVEAIDLPADRPFATVTASLVRVDDPAWSAMLAAGAPQTLEIGSTAAVFEFESLGPGRYELQLTGFEAEAPVRFEAPHADTILVRGRPRGAP